MQHSSKKRRSIIGKDITRAIQDFFDAGRMLKEINATAIALIPKVSTQPDPEEVSEAYFVLQYDRKVHSENHSQQKKACGFLLW